MCGNSNLYGMKFIVVMTFFVSKFDGTPLGTTGTSLRQKGTMQGGFNNYEMVRNGSEHTDHDLALIEFSEFTTSTRNRYVQNYAGAVIIPGSSKSHLKASSVQETEGISSRRSGSSTELNIVAAINKALMNYRTSSTRGTVQQSLNGIDAINSNLQGNGWQITEKATSFEELGKSIRNLGKPVIPKCTSCPEDQSFCCKSGCCSRVAMWTEPPGLYILIVWIFVITFAVGLSSIACKSKDQIRTVAAVHGKKTKTCSPKLVLNPVVYRLKYGQVKIKIASSSTCESNLSDDHVRHDDIFEPEFPDFEYHEENCHVTDQSEDCQEEFEYHENYDCSNDVSYHVDHTDYYNDCTNYDED